MKEPAKRLTHLSGGQGQQALATPKALPHDSVTWAFGQFAHRGGTQLVPVMSCRRGPDPCRPACPSSPSYLP